MSNSSRKRIGYIVSMKHSMDAWTFREVELLLQRDNRVSLFPTKSGNGPYQPKAQWDCYRYVPWLVVLRQPTYFIRKPSQYLAMLREAIRMRTVVDFMLGTDFASQMEKRRIGLVHCVFGDRKLFIGYYCKKLLGIPLSVALYGQDLTVNPNWAMFRKAIHAADAIMVNCEFNRRLLSEVAGPEVADRAQIIRHHAPVYPESELNKVKVLIVGRFEDRKGHDVLFEALRRLGDDARGIEIWVAGIPGTVDIGQLARDIGVDDRVRIFGQMSDSGLRVLYQECDIFCLPSRTDSEGCSEGLPVSLIEAMANAKPVISTRLAGIPELVEETLIEEGSIDELASALRRLAGDASLRRRLGDRNRDIVEAFYSVQNIELLEDLFEHANEFPSNKHKRIPVVGDRS